MILQSLGKALEMVISYLQPNSNSTDSNEIKHHSWCVWETARFIANLSQHEENRTILIEQGVDGRLLDILFNSANPSILAEAIRAINNLCHNGRSHFPILNSKKSISSLLNDNVAMGGWFLKK